MLSSGDAIKMFILHGGTFDSCHVTERLTTGSLKLFLCRLRRGPIMNPKSQFRPLLV